MKVAKMNGKLYKVQMAKGMKEEGAEHKDVPHGNPDITKKLVAAHLKKDVRGTVCENCIAY